MAAVLERLDADLRLKSPTSLELFAGAGGLALGLDLAGFHPDLVVEIDDRAVKTLEANHSRKRDEEAPWPIKKADVRTLTFNSFAGVDLLAAGPPCQPFSIGGHRKGRHDDRDLMPEAIRAVRESRPKAFLIENVRGLTFPAVRSYLDYSIAQLRHPSEVNPGDDELDHARRLAAIPAADREYRVEWRLLNAADFGLPQQRVRLVIIGVRADLPEWSWPLPTHSRQRLMDELEGDRYWAHYGVTGSVRDAARLASRQTKGALARSKESDVGTERWRTVRDVLADLGAPGSDPHDKQHQMIEGARLYRKHRGSLLDWPAKTVKAGVHGTPGGEHIVILDDGSHRYFTIRECALLQGFPRKFQLPDLRSVALRQLGNAVPVPLAEALGRQLGALLQSANGAKQ